MGKNGVKMRQVWFFITLLTVALVSISGWWWANAAPENEANLGETVSSALRERPCAVSDSTQSVSVRCLWISVGDGVELSVAVIEGKRDKVDYSAPLVYLPGGPGTQSNSDGDMLAYWRDWYIQAALARPFVIVDYRYLAPSLPNYQCLSYRRTVQRILDANLTMSEEGEWLHPAFLSCLEQAEDALGASLLENVNTPTNARDVRSALIHLGYSQWHLLGVSYGTRVALYAAMTQVEVQRVVLDSPYAFASGHESQLAALWQTAFEAFFVRCRAAGTCQSLGVTETLLYETFQRLRENPLRVQSENWQTDVIQNWLLNDVRLASFLFQLAYSSGNEETMARMIRSAHQGEVDASAALEIYYNSVLDPHFNEWIYLATECADSPRDSVTEYREGLAKVDEPWKTFFSGLDRFNSCTTIPHNPLLEQMRSVFQPALVIMGDSDPITTKEHALPLQRWLKNATFWTREGLSHAESLTDECSIRVLRAFLDGVVNPVAETRTAVGC